MPCYDDVSDYLQASLRSEAISASRRAAPVLNTAGKPNQRPASFHATVPQTTGMEPMTKKKLQNLNAAPKSRMRDDWIGGDDQSHGRIDDEHRKHMRRSEIMRREMPNTQDHWLVEEAERRRQREKYGSPDPYNQPIPPASDRLMPPIIDRGSSRSPPAPNQGATHIMEHVQEPVIGRPGKPIPEAIKQTLMQRVNIQLKSPTSSYPSMEDYNSPSYPAHQTHMDPGPPLPARHYYDENNGASDAARYDPQQRLAGGGSSTSLQHQGAYTHSSPVKSSGLQYNDQQQPPAKPPRSTGGVSSEESHAEQVVSVSGKQRCSHCQKELGEFDREVK